MSAEKPVLSADELETLQELMNIAFGQASAYLAEATGQPVGLTVPAAQVMPAVLLRYYVGAEIKGEGRVAVLEQRLDGDLQGGAFLVLPETVGDPTMRVTGEKLVRGCATHLAGLLRGVVRFDEPRIAVDGRKEAAARADPFQKDHPALILRSQFGLGAPPVTGHLFLACSPACIQWLRGALPRFLAQYA